MLFARTSPAFICLAAEADNFEEDALDGGANGPQEQIVSIRKKVIIFRRCMAPQRGLITDLLEVS